MITGLQLAILAGGLVAYGVIAFLMGLVGYFR